MRSAEWSTGVASSWWYVLLYEHEPPLLQKDTKVLHLLSAFGELPIKISSMKSVFPSDLNCAINEALLT